MGGDGPLPIQAAPSFVKPTGGRPPPAPSPPIPPPSTLRNCARAASGPRSRASHRNAQIASSVSAGFTATSGGCGTLHAWGVGGAWVGRPPPPRHTRTIRSHRGRLGTSVPERARVPPRLINYIITGLPALTPSSIQSSPRIRSMPDTKSGKTRATASHRWPCVEVAKCSPLLRDPSAASPARWALARTATPRRCARACESKHRDAPVSNSTRARTPCAKSAWKVRRGPVATPDACAPAAVIATVVHALRGGLPEVISATQARRALKHGSTGLSTMVRNAGGERPVWPRAAAAGLIPSHDSTRSSTSSATC